MTVTPTVTPTNTLTPTPTFTPTPSSTPTGDADAQAYLAEVVNQGGTVTSDITAAVETLFTDLKSAGIYSKMDIFMPMIGGVKNSMIINAKDPTNTTLQWTEFGTPLTYNVSGITGNNNGALRSNFIMSDLTQATTGSTHFASYLNRLNVTEGKGYLNGFIDTSGLPYGYYNCHNYTTNLYGGLWGSETLGDNVTPVTGVWMRNRETNDSLIQYVNNTSVGSNGTTNNFLPTNLTQGLGLFTLYWSSQPNNLYPGEIGDHRYAWVSIGAGLTSTERTNLYNAINTFQTTLGRA
jgi:hypothetical protein